MLSGHLIALQGKRPIAHGWQHVPWNGVQLRGQNGIGIIPWSVGCVVVDVDDPAGEQAAIDALGEPLARQGTPSGGVHLIYRANKSLPNSKWTYGDIRGGRGYVRVYDKAAWRAATALRYDATAPDIDTRCRSPAGRWRRRPPPTFPRRSLPASKSCVRRATTSPSSHRESMSDESNTRRVLKIREQSTLCIRLTANERERRCGRRRAPRRPGVRICETGSHHCTASSPEV